MSSSYDPVALAAAAAAAPPPPAPEPMPLSMTYTSLAWLNRTGSAGVPRLADETPPTSPEKRRASRGGGGGAAQQLRGKDGATAAAVSETPEQRRARQEAFKRSKQEALRRILEGKADSEAQPEEDGTAVAVAPAAPTTPPRKVRPSAAALAAEAAAASSASLATLVSPEKRRAKKLSSLQFPIFSVYWWDFPPAALQPGSSSGSAAKAADQHPASLGLVLLGGGGGKKGAGIDSGMLVCSVLPSTAPVFALGNSPIRPSSASSRTMLLHPTAFLDSHDYLIGHIAPHPQLPVLAATVGAGTAILEASAAAVDQEDREDADASSGPPPPTLSYCDLVQTDFSKELNAQAQAWSPSGSWLVTGGEDRVLRAWSYPALELIAVLGSDATGQPIPGTQHRHGILSLDVNHDGTRVASCAGDGNIKIWNTARLEGVLAADDDAEAEDAPAEEKGDAAAGSSPLLRCPLVKDISIPLIKGSILKFQVAKFYGKPRVSRRNAPRRERGGEEEKEGEAAHSASPANEADGTSTGTEYLMAIASQIRRGGGSSSLIKLSVADDEWARVKQVQLGTAALTTMELSDEWRNPLVALANTDGQVAVYSADTMSCLHRVHKCHDLPTTGLAFSPSRLSAATPTSPAKSRWLLSASADKSVALIELPTAGSSSRRRTILFFVLAVIMLLLALLLGKEPWNLPESDL